MSPRRRIKHFIAGGAGSGRLKTVFPPPDASQTVIVENTQLASSSLFTKLRRAETAAPRDQAPR